MFKVDNRVMTKHIEKDENMATVESKIRELLEDTDVTVAEFQEHLTKVAAEMEIEKRAFDRGYAEGHSVGYSERSDRVYSMYYNGSFRTFNVVGLTMAGGSGEYHALLEVFELTKGHNRTDDYRTYGIKFPKGGSVSFPA